MPDPASSSSESSTNPTTSPGAALQDTPPSNLRNALQIIAFAEVLPNRDGAIVLTREQKSALVDRIMAAVGQYEAERAARKEVLSTIPFHRPAPVNPLAAELEQSDRNNRERDGDPFAFLEEPPKP